MLFYIVILSIQLLFFSNFRPQVPANFKDVVFTAGVKYGGVEEWKYIYNKFIGEIVPTEKKRLLRTLGKTTDTTLLNR